MTISFPPQHINSYLLFIKTLTRYFIVMADIVIIGYAILLWKLTDIYRIHTVIAKKTLRFRFYVLLRNT